MGGVKLIEYLKQILTKNLPLKRQVFCFMKDEMALEI
jgi:hypothetical protein